MAYFASHRPRQNWAGNSELPTQHPIQRGQPVILKESKNFLTSIFVLSLKGWIIMI